MGGDVTTLPTPIGATYTVAGVQHCMITTAAPDTNLYTEDQLKQFGREFLDRADAICREELQEGIRENNGQWIVCSAWLRTKILDLKEQL